MSRLSAIEVTSYTGGATSIGAALTLPDLGVVIGIVTALLTFVINVAYMYRKDRREQRESDAKIASLDVKP